MSSPWTPRFTAAEVAFSLKSFAAGMLAMYVASRAGLPRPFWSIVTAYVVANPMAGAVRSKALYRFLGTLLGSGAALVLVPALGNAPELLTLALALWVAVCLFFALLDRTPRSYVLMLAGYSAALIGFPAVGAPQGIFESASARVEEIGLGILCATLVHSLVWPSSMSSTILAMIDRTLNDARAWTRDIVSSHGAGSPTSATPAAADRRRLAGDITQLRLLSTHLPFDTSNLRWTAGAVRALQDRVAALTPAVSAIEERLQALRIATGHVPGDVARVSQAVVQRVMGEQSVSSADDICAAADSDGLRSAIRALAQPPASEQAASAWERALRTALSVRLEDLLRQWRACTRLRADIDTGLAGSGNSRALARNVRGPVLHRDFGMALWSALAAALAICACSAFWIATGWSSGAAMPMMAAVFCCFFAGQDDPTPAIYAFLKALLYSIPLGALYVLVLMPLISDFGTLVLVCAPVFVLLGCYLARPAAFMTAMALLLTGLLGTLSLHDTGQADFLGFINSTIAQNLGVAAAGIITALVRSVGAAWSARRIQKKTWQELGEMAGAAAAADHERDAIRILDRIGMLAPRIAEAGGTIAGIEAEDALADVRISADIHALQRHRGALPPALARNILAELARFYREHPRDLSTVQAAGQRPGLAALLDQAVAALQQGQAAVSVAGRRALAAVVGLRCTLFPELPVTLQPPRRSPHDRRRKFLRHLPALADGAGPAGAAAELGPAARAGRRGCLPMDLARGPVRHGRLRAGVVFPDEPECLLACFFMIVRSPSLPRPLMQAARILLTLLVVALACWALLRLWDHYELAPWTRDGRVRANVVQIAPDVSGPVTTVPVHDNQAVKRGDVLFEIDTARFELALQRARAEVESAQVVLAQARREDARNRALNDVVSQELREQTRTRMEAAGAALARAEVELRSAQLNRERATVRAPADGWVTNLELREGGYAAAGHPLVALIDRDSFYVEGYFEETKLPRIHVGDQVRVTPMGSRTALEGQVQSVAAGIADRDRSTGANLLPSVNPTFNWVRLAQRVPVRVALKPQEGAAHLVAGQTVLVEVVQQAAGAKAPPASAAPEGMKG